MFTTEIKARLAAIPVGSTVILNGRTVTRTEYGYFIVRDADRPGLAKYRLDAETAADALED